MTITNKEDNFEKILELVGDSGKYQHLLLWLFIVPVNFIIPWSILVPIFQASVPDHWCHVLGKPDNISIEHWKNITIPWVKENGDTVRSKCLQFTNISQRDVNDDSLLDLIGCQNGWEFDTTWYDKTLPSDNEWVCDKGSNPARWLSVGVAGNVFGTVIFNSLSDYWGRKPTVILTAQIYALFAILRLFVTSEWGILVVMFISCLPFPPIIEVSLIYALEQVSGELRARITGMSFMMWTAGMCLVPFLAWLCRTWVLLGIITSVPFVTLIIMWWLLPESPRWLVSKGRTKEAASVLRRIAAINGKSCPDRLESMLEALAHSELSQKKSFYLSYIDLFKYPIVRKRTFILSMCYICDNLIYYGILYNIGNMSGNTFLNFFFLSITEIPANAFGWVFSQTIGRRLTEAGFIGLSAVLAAVAMCIPATYQWTLNIILVSCKMSITVSFLVIYLQIAEIFPTSHRSSGSGVASILGSVVGTTAPYIAYSGTFWSNFPYFILFLLGALGSIAALFLPETMGTSLPQTMSEAEVLLTTQPFWSYLGKRITIKKKEANELKVIPIIDGGANPASSLNKIT